MQKDTLKTRTSNTRSRQIGRGGRRGKTSGRGHKGQKARAGHKIRPEVRDVIKAIPKLKGHSFIGAPKKIALVVNVSDLEKAFAAGDSVSPNELAEKGMVRMKKGTRRSVKVLGNGDLSKKLTVSGCLVSGAAREKIEKAGGTVEEK